MKKVQKVTRRLIFVFALALIFQPYTSVFAEDVSDNVIYPAGVTKEMTKVSYWKNVTKNSDKVLMTTDEIKEFNKSLVEASEKTNIVDLESLTEVASGEYSKMNRELYLDGQQINEDDLIAKFDAGHKKLENLLYSVAVKRCELKIWPISGFLGYTADDPDNEATEAILNVNDPFVIGGVCMVDGHKFYYGKSTNCDGWVDGDNIAICSSKEEWIDSWKVDESDKDFIVVVDDKITTEPSTYIPSTSEVELMMGTVLKLVPKSEIPEKIGERGSWFNYVVYLPTRDDDGKYVKQMALISEKENVSEGYMPLTQTNLMQVAFNCLGNRFGWGGCLKAYDSSLYHRAVYTCFGINLPRNGTWQRAIPGKFSEDIKELSDEEKIEYLKMLPSGTIIYFPGFSMQYVGTVDNVPYVICSCGNVSDSIGELKLRKMYSVLLVPLTARRASGNTWLSELFGVLNIFPNVLDDTEASTEKTDNEPTKQTTPVVTTVPENKSEQVQSQTNKATTNKAKVTLKVKVVKKYKKKATVKLTWTTNTKGLNKIYVYRLKKKIATLKGNKKSYKIKKLKRNKKYKFKVVLLKGKVKIKSKYVTVKIK